MNARDEQNHVSLRLVRGGLYGKPRRRRQPSPQQVRLDRRMHDRLVRFYGADGNVPSRGIQQVRDKKSFPWRTLAKRLQEGRDAGVPIEDAKAVVQVWSEYVEALYDQSSGTSPNEAA